MAETPLMKQFFAVKAKYPDALILFRMGDFYETFGEDAIIASKILGITLTKRSNGASANVELAGFPYHAIDTYLPKLVKAGQRVAICEQLEDPKTAKGLVKRGITELVTPGISFNDNVLEQKENNFLAAVVIDKQLMGVAFLDISTGEFYATEGNKTYISKLLLNFNPKEVLFDKTQKQLVRDSLPDTYNYYGLDDWVFSEENAVDKLTSQFKTTTVKGFGLEGMRCATIAAGAILDYLDLTRHDRRDHIRNLSRIDEDRFVWIDRFTIRNLELLAPSTAEGKSLLDVLDRTHTPMGARLLRRWIVLPLKDIDEINNRLAVVDLFRQNHAWHTLCSEQLSKIGDLERLASKIAVLRINPREFLAIQSSLDAIADIVRYCSSSDNDLIKKIGKRLSACTEIRRKIKSTIKPDSPALLNKGNVIAAGVSQELDELRDLSLNSKRYLYDLEKRETAQTGITSLKVGFNNVFGYYFEVRNTHKDKVPADWVRKQTLVSAERYINTELKQYEEKILGAEERIQVLENQLYTELMTFAAEYIGEIQKNASSVAGLDCLLSFADVAVANKYVKPELNDGFVIDIKGGRHPVIERQLPPGEEYISNDIFLDNDTQQIMMITGPNMSGKSALLRQTALICLMSQIGSFVPALSAQIGLIDKVFTRVGASDNISMGESTFMVEMLEAANIMNNISPRSLILLDELGRGTSTYDGISIAWAIAEYIHEHPRAKAKTLFATHYHELNEMERSYKRIKNYNVSVKEAGDRVIFLRKLQPGGSEHSFGIHVAQMAGMPKSVIFRAKEILEHLEGKAKNVSGARQLDKSIDTVATQRSGYQLSFFQLDDPVLSQIKKELINIDINQLSPLDALNKLNEIQKLAGAK